VTVLNVIFFLSSRELATVYNYSDMMQETEIINALYEYPELTYIEEAEIMIERYKRYNAKFTSITI
jgi:hypothetical protein